LNGYAQIPEEFNYQAVLRNNSGELLVSQAVEIQISIINNNAGGAVLYTETHNKTTNAYGLVNLVIGTGTGTDDFSDIDWAADKRFVGVQVDAGSGLTDLGAFQLLSVPYALYANSASNLGSDNIYIPEPDTLFAVKDHSGNVVFAVFPDGVKVIVAEATAGNVGGFAVSGRGPTMAEETDIFRVTPDSTRIYVNDTIQSKGRVGGFAVSGRSPTKGINQDYLVVTQDSTRIYVNDSISTKGRVGGFAVSGRSPTKGSLNNYMEVTRDSTRIYISDTILSKGRVGGFAVSGRSPTKGDDKQYFNITGSASAQKIVNESRIMWYPEKSALLAGELNIPNPDSVGEYSISLGFHNIAKGKWSQAMGYQSVARGDYSTAIGYEAIADTNSFAFGNGSKALGFNSFAFGAKGVNASGDILETYTTASGDFSFAFGLGSYASGLGSIVMGTNSTAIGDFSTAMGFNTDATGLHSMAMGANSTASGDSSTALGFNTDATGVYSMAMGVNNISEGRASFTMGSGNTAAGEYSMALGANNNANGPASVAFGQGNNAGDYAIVGGFNNIASGARSFAVGSNNSTSGDGAIAAGFSNECSQSYSVAFGSNNTSGGVNSFAIGANTQATGLNSVTFGLNTIANADNSLAGGRQSKATAIGAVAFGDVTVASGEFSVAAGFSTTAESYATLVVGQYNVLEGGTTDSWDPVDPLFIAGNGTSPAPFNRGNAMILYKDGNMTIAGTLTQDSDERLKENIVKIDNVLLDVLKINPIYYEFKNKETHPSGKHIGFIAQEIEPLFPELVKSSSKGFLSVEYANMTAVLLQAIKEQQKIINDQNKKTEELESKLKLIMERLEKLESK